MGTSFINFLKHKCMDIFYRVPFHSGLGTATSLVTLDDDLRRELDKRSIPLTAVPLQDGCLSGVGTGQYSSVSLVPLLPLWQRVVPPHGAWDTSGVSAVPPETARRHHCGSGSVLSLIC